MSRLTNWNVSQAQAKRRLPGVAFDFVDEGAEDEVTLSRNRSAFQDLALVPRVLRGVGEVSAETEIFGQRLRMPVMTAPTGGAELFVVGPRAYSWAARGAEAAGTITVLSGHQVAERVAASVSVPQWLQVYTPLDRSLTEEAVERGKRLGFTALVLTADTPTVGNRERTRRHGFTVPLRLHTPRMVFDAGRRPRWLWQYFLCEANRRATLSQGLRGRLRDIGARAQEGRRWLDPHQTWEYLGWLRSLWDGPLLLKGVMCAEDAVLAIEAGCEGVVVSNHGGRQLDGAPASIEVLPEVVAAVDGRGEVLLDSGVRRGSDVVKAVSLGAKACLVGRPWVFAAVNGGQEGVTRMLDQFHYEITTTMQLLGARSIAELGPEFVRRRPGTGWERIPASSAVTA